MPGDMGHGCGKALLDNGFNVFTCLSNRSERTKSLAKKSGIKDTHNIENLLNSGWRVGVIWECATYGKNRLENSFILNSLSNWLENDQRKLEISSLNAKHLIN